MRSANRGNANNTWNVNSTGNVKRQRRKLRRLVAKSRRGLIPRDKVDESYKAWRNHASKGNTFNLLQRMDKYYKDLWRNTNGACKQK